MELDLPHLSKPSKALTRAATIIFIHVILFTFKINITVISIYL